MLQLESKMGCCGKKDNAPDDAVKAVLGALSASSSPMGNKEIAAATGLDEKKLASAMKKLKDGGMIESPVRCKYTVSDKGKAGL